MIEIQSKPKATVEVPIDGVTFKVKRPKAALALKLAVRSKQMETDPALFQETIDELVDAMFTKADATKIKKRLNSATDDLDVDDIMDLMTKLTEAETGETPTS